MALKKERVIANIDGFIFLCSILLLSVLLVSCNNIIFMLVGLKQPKNLTDERIIKWGEKLGIDKHEVYKLDSKLFQELLSEIKDTIIRKNWYQPLQVKSFDKKGILNAHLINCNMGGQDKDWNYWHSFDKFPIQYNDSIRVDTVIALDKELSMIAAVSNQLNFPDYKNADEILIVYWSRMMNKWSLSLISTVQDYRRKNSDKKIIAYFVNMDNFYSDMEDKGK